MADVKIEGVLHEFSTIPGVIEDVTDIILNIKRLVVRTDSTPPKKIRIEASSGLKEDEIKDMVRDAESNAAEDKARREEITTRNETDQLIYQTEKNITEMEEQMSADDKAKLEAAVERAKEALKKSDHAEITSARDGLNAVWHEVAEKVYSQAQAQQQAEGGEAPPQPESPESSDDAGAVDADYEVVD